MTFSLIDKSCGLYISDQRIPKEPSFSPAYFTQNDFGWYRSETNDTYFKYDRQLQRVLCQKFGRNLPKALTDEDFIQFCNKTIY